MKCAWIRACVKARPLDHPDRNASQKRIGQYGNCVLNVCQRVFSTTSVSCRSWQACDQESMARNARTFIAYVLWDYLVQSNLRLDLMQLPTGVRGRISGHGFSFHCLAAVLLTVAQHWRVQREGVHMYLYHKSEDLLMEGMWGPWNAISGITLPSRNSLPYLTGNHAECVWGSSLTSTVQRVNILAGQLLSWHAW